MSIDIADDEQPLVSIICRSTGRPELQHALASVAAQTHTPLELILVEASGIALDVADDTCRPATLLRVNAGQRLPRPAAANAGLQAATGEFCMLLDEDDWIAPDHIAGLLQALRSHGGIEAVYSSTQKTDPAGAATGYVFDADFDPVLLLRDNYIPIHAMLFSRTLLDRGCVFDEDFDIYEDWDFWLQLQQQTDFLHVEQLTAFYREGGESATAASDVSVRYDGESALGQARARLFDKWLPRFSGEQFNALLGQMDQSALIRELGDKLDSEHATNLAHQQQIASLLSELEQARHALSQARSELENTRQSLRAHIDELENSLRSIYASTSWKITGPYRVIGRRLKALGDRHSDPDKRSR